MEKYAILENSMVEETDVHAYLKWVRDDGDFAKRRIGYTELAGEVTVSTVFLGMNHQFEPNAPALWFETLVFGGVLDGEMERYTTYSEAKAGHERMVSLVKEREAVK